MERVCNACWVAAKRQLQRQRQQDSNRTTLADAVQSGDASIPEPHSLPRQQPQRPEQVIPKVQSFLYRRAANTSGHCIFVNCFET